MREVLPSEITQRPEITGDVNKGQDTKATFFRLHANSDLLIIIDLAQLVCSSSAVPSFPIISELINEAKDLLKSTSVGIVLFPETPAVTSPSFEEASKLHRQILELVEKKFPTDSCIRFEFSCLAEVNSEEGEQIYGRQVKSSKRLVKGIVISNCGFGETAGLAGFILRANNCLFLSNTHIPTFRGLPWTGQLKYNDAGPVEGGEEAEDSSNTLVSKRAIKVFQRGWRFFADLLLDKSGFNLKTYCQSLVGSKSSPFVVYDMIPAAGDIWVVALVNRLVYYGCYNRRIERVSQQVAITRMVSNSIFQYFV